MVPHMSKYWLIILLLVSYLYAGAQSIRLSKYDAPNALYLDADRLYDFNMYERSRLNLSMIWVSPNQTAAQQRSVFGQWMLWPYVGYGFGDHAWKYGLGTQLRLPGRRDVRMLLWVYNDVERAATRRLDDYTTLTPSLNSGIVTSRYSGVRGGTFDLIFSPSRDWSVTLGVLQTWEDYRFDSTGFFYPSAEPLRVHSLRAFSELRARMGGKAGVTLLLVGGRVADTSARYYARALAQYNADFGTGGLHLYAQLGFATEGTPYSRMFDLSGTAFSTYFFKNSFLTVRPNTFTANIFTHICLNYTAPLPLWKLSWSEPHPFLQLNALWGHLFGQDGEGRICWEGLPLQSPYRGLLEPATGFKGLVHWGLTDIGFGVAYQICSNKASYFPQRLEDNLAFTLVADFILDNIK